MSRIHRRIALCAWAILILSAWPTLVSAAGPLDLAITAGDVDFAASKAWRADGEKPVDEADLMSVLGLDKIPNQRTWIAGDVKGGTRADFHYLIVLKQPVSIGSLLAFGTAKQVSYLKAGAPLPKSPSDSANLVSLSPPVRHSGGRLYTLDAPIQTRALLLSDLDTPRRSEVDEVRLFKARLQNVTPAARAYALHEYTSPESQATQSASYVTMAKSYWASSGKDDKGLVSTPTVSDIHPEWFLLTWDKPQTVTGIWLLSNTVTYSLEYFVGPESVNPRVGTPAEWRRVREFTERFEKERRDVGHPRWISFPSPLTTRGLRFNITKVDGRQTQIATIHGLHVLTDLQNGPAQELAAQNAGPMEPPYQLSYEIAQPGNLTLAINDAQGRRVRNLISREPAESGKFAQSWNLKDEEGSFITPGTYSWSAITLPQLQPKYEFTVYPNVSMIAPGNSPWLNGHNGSGGWMADHTAPLAVCVGGDHVYLGSPVAESGVSLIECDLTGAKTWGYHSFAAWTGPRHLASDGKTVFVGSPILGDAADNVWAVDLATKEVKKLIAVEPTAVRQRGIAGLAVRGDELYMAVQAKENWLVNAAAAEDVDLYASYPTYRVARKERFAHEAVPKPQEDFLRLLRLKGTPPGQPHLDGALNALQSQKSTAQRQHIVVAFHRSVPLGGVALPMPPAGVRVELSVHKPGASYPPLADDDKQWIPFPEQAKNPWDVIAAPEGTNTRALRVTLIKGDLPKEDDLLAGGPKKPAAIDLNQSFELDKPKGAAAAGLNDFGPVAEQWLGKIDGLKLLRRRFRNVSGEAAIHVNSGKVEADGSWDAKRTRPITSADPAIYALEWKTTKKLRGLAIKEVDGKTNKVEIYTGPPGKIDVNGSEGWEHVGDYQQARRYYYHPDDNHNSHAPYLDGYFDFGREIETCAVRVRVTEQWPDNSAARPYGTRSDWGGLTLDPARCHVLGIAALEYLGGEPEVDRAGDCRIEVFAKADGKLERELTLDRVGRIAFNPAGELFGVSGTSIIKIDPSGKGSSPVVTDLEKPSDLAFDSAGNLYVFDGSPQRSQIRVYDQSGKFVRTVGKPGGFQVGPWDPERLGNVSDIDIDGQGQLWVVEQQYYPKRITVWSTDGTFKKELLGNTAYGGGGTLNPWDKTQLFYRSLEFELDWKTGKSRLKNLTSLTGTDAGDLPIRIGGRQYLVTRPEFAFRNCAIIYLYDKDRLKLAAAIGKGSEFAPLKRPEMISALGGKSLSETTFVWSDHNGNGEVEPDEVKTSTRTAETPGLTPVNRDLSVQAGPTLYVVKEFLPGGVPVYEEKQNPQLVGRLQHKLDDGSFFRIGSSKFKDGVARADGSLKWTYPNEGDPIGQAINSAKPWHRSQVVAQFGVVGHDTAPAGDLGEFVVLHTNVGGWTVYTADGLLVGPVFRDLRDPQAVPWSMQEHQRGMTLENITAGQEHFSGYVCRTFEDGKIYAVAGHNHISVVELPGLNEARRYQGTITVTPEDIRQAQAWDVQHEQESVYARAPVVDCFRARETPVLDGKINEWGPASSTIDEFTEFRIAYDDTRLYAAYKIGRKGPLKNSGTQWDRLFKSGACVDLQMGLDPAAAIDRTGPVPGDVRLLMTWMQGKPICVSYRPEVPGTPKSQQWQVVSPVGQATFDEVKPLAGVEIARSTDEVGAYIVEAAIPLAAIGLKPEPGMRLKLDWGILTTGPDGNEVLRRIYWSNQATSITSDAPSEARLQPNLWGFVLFHGQNRPSAEDQLETVAADPPKNGKEVKKDVDDILDVLNEGKKKK